MEYRTHEVAKRLTKDLKVKPKVRTPQLIEYARRLNIPGSYESSNGLFFYIWSENDYQKLLKIFKQ